MTKRVKVIGVAALAVATLIALGWVFIVPGEVKTLVRFLRWHDAHLRASGYVDREPAGTRIYWEEFGKPDGPPVIVLHAGLCAIAFMGGQIESLAAESYRVIAIDAGLPQTETALDSRFGSPFPHSLISPMRCRTHRS